MTQDGGVPATRGDLSVTALYTAGVWDWAGFPGAELVRHDGTLRVFRVVEVFLGLARWFNPGTASLKHSLQLRHAFFDEVVRREDPEQVLELAAGLSPRGAAFTEGDRGPRWVEVDLPPMVARKEALLQATGPGREVLGRGRLRRIGADVTATSLDEILSTTGASVVLAEGLLMYLDAPAQQALFARVASWLRPRGGVLAFDLVPAVEQPPPGWWARTFGALMRAATGGEGIVSDERTAADVISDLLAAGFDEVQTVVPADEAEAWGLPVVTEPTLMRCFVARVVGP